MYNASCQRHRMQSGDHLPGGGRLLRDNTLRAIWLYLKAHLGDPVMLPFQSARHLKFPQLSCEISSHWRRLPIF